MLPFYPYRVHRRSSENASARTDRRGSIGAMPSQASPWYFLASPKEYPVIDPELLEILACPENKTPVRLAEPDEVDALNARIRAGGVTNRGGEPVTEIDGGLIREDGKFLYAIRDEIPIMLIDEAIPLESALQE